jgi:subtilisin-like proprotein convertase family protein
VQADFIETFSPNLTIPDGNPVGAVFYGTVSDLPSGDTVSGLTVSLNLSGGYNGSLYAYLVAPNGTLVTLVNQPGATSGNPLGYAGSGFNVTLADAAATGIQTTPETPGAVLTGTYQAAGSLSGFNGSPADGVWTLFLADLIADSGAPTLNSLTLDLPSGVVLLPDDGGTLFLLGGALLTLAALRQRLPTAF